MTNYMNIPQSKIFKTENKESLEKKLSDLRHKDPVNTSSLEAEIIEIFVASLLAHGKDRNQMRQIAQISKILGQSLGLGLAYCDKLEQAARIYDVGNVMICQEIYQKDEKLSFEEFEAVKYHTFMGKELLEVQKLPTTDLAAVISEEHHEWWDGGGYPSQKKNREIDIASRIVAVADAIGALFRKRPGRNAWEYKKILEYVKGRSGIQFDPDVVDVFLINQDAIHEILLVDLEHAPSEWYA
ncbi:MAG: HD domain-containing protein [Sulfurovum sp.]|nr:HD domain-containing protein [Sulfurovum sp.]